MLDAYADQILGFVMARRHKSGGFAAAPTLPPSIEDTYYALSILKVIFPHSKDAIEAIQEESKLSGYLRKTEDKETWRARTVYHYLCSCYFAGVAKVEDISWIKRHLAEHSKSIANLSEYYYQARIVREYLSEVLSEGEGNLLKRPSPKWRTLRELWMLLYIANSSPEHLFTTRKKLVTWVQACQNPDGGFGYLPGTTSFIENTHFSMRILSQLRAKPQHPEKVREFIMRCKTARGGFSRRNGAAPFLDTTWHAVAALCLLEKPESQCHALQEGKFQPPEHAKENRGLFKNEPKIQRNYFI